MRKFYIMIALIFSIVTTFARDMQAPDFTLKDQYGITHTLSNYKGKVVFLNFWATWCPPCRMEMPDIEKLYKEYGKNKKDVIFLGVNDEGEKQLKSFFEENKYTFPTVIAEEALLRKYYIRAYPTTFIIDKNGNIYRFATGVLTEEQMKTVLEEALKK